MNIAQQRLEHMSSEHIDWVFVVEGFGWRDAPLLLLLLFLMIVAVRRLRRRGRSRQHTE